MDFCLRTSVITWRNLVTQLTGHHWGETTWQEKHCFSAYSTSETILEKESGASIWNDRLTNVLRIKGTWAIDSHHIPSFRDEETVSAQTNCCRCYCSRTWRLGYPGLLWQNCYTFAWISFYWRSWKWLLPHPHPHPGCLLLPGINVRVPLLLVPVLCLLLGLHHHGLCAAQSQVQLMHHYFLIMAFVRLIVYSNRQRSHEDFILKSVTFVRNKLNTF